ncbi:hypothetical protein CCMA1212_002651 [Trichoderma ghanense]|uniref:Uncharacterized protein n=1 Tax=Trichoderma ghanense TaxID=65468 RepID=A0ABY2HBL0_9HYPO
MCSGSITGSTGTSDDASSSRKSHSTCVIPLVTGKRDWEIGRLLAAEPICSLIESHQSDAPPDQRRKQKTPHQVAVKTWKASKPTSQGNGTASNWSSPNSGNRAPALQPAMKIHGQPRPHAVCGSRRSITAVPGATATPQRLDIGAGRSKSPAAGAAGAAATTSRYLTAEGGLKSMAVGLLCMGKVSSRRPSGTRCATKSAVKFQQLSFGPRALVTALLSANRRLPQSRLRSRRPKPQHSTSALWRRSTCTARQMPTKGRPFLRPGLQLIFVALSAKLWKTNSSSPGRFQNTALERETFSAACLAGRTVGPAES